MSYRRAVAVLVASTALGVAAPAASADTFLDLPPLMGDSQVDGHEDQIVVSEYAFNVAVSRSAGRARFSDFTIRKHVDKSSPLLMQDLAAGQHFPHATLYVTKVGTNRDEFLRYCFTDVKLTRLEQSGASEAPEETVSFYYATVVQRFDGQTSTGTPDAVFGGWNVLRNLQYGPGNCT